MVLLSTVHTVGICGNDGDGRNRYILQLGHTMPRGSILANLLPGELIWEEKIPPTKVQYSAWLELKKVWNIVKHL